MDKTHPERTAKIYQFPVRALAQPRRPAYDAVRAAEAPFIRTPHIEFGSAWYHDAAIQDASRAPKP